MGESSLTKSLVLHLKYTFLVLIALSSIIRPLVNSVWIKLCTWRKRIKWRVQCTDKCLYNAGKHTSHWRRFNGTGLYIAINGVLSCHTILISYSKWKFKQIQLWVWKRICINDLYKRQNITQNSLLHFFRDIHNATAGICLSKRIVRHSFMHAI